jgi:hypothetical protein
MVRAHTDMRGFALLVFCLLCAARAADATPSAVVSVRAEGHDRGFVSGASSGAPRFRQVYREQRRPVVARMPPRQEAQAPLDAYGGGQIVQHPAGCPAQLFCGCGASIEAFGHSVRDLWVVSNWYQFPSAAPAAGMAVLWGTRHVAIIREYFGDGTAMLYDANSGNGLTRVHRRRIAGLAVVDPHAGMPSAWPTPSSLMVIL